MKQSQTQILETLKLYPSTEHKKYAAKLSAMFSLVNELEKMKGFKVSLAGKKGNFEMVKLLPEIKEEDFKDRNKYYERFRSLENLKELFCEFSEWDTILISHDKGEYKFPFPCNNVYYNIFVGLSGGIIEMEAEVKEEITILKTITVDSKIFKSFGKAVKFISSDDLRPAMQHVCLHIQNNLAEVSATDAHRLYYSQKFESSQIDKVELLFSEKTAKELSKIKFLSGKTDIAILPDSKVMIEGIIYPVGADMRFPDSRCVIPAYETFMQFEKDKFVASVKKCLPSANKVTKQVTLHLNGAISMNCQDVDYGYETAATIPYNSKNFRDTDIAFNGSFLIDALSIFKEKEIKMYSEGSARHAALFTNEIETVLVMPLMLHN